MDPLDFSKLVNQFKTGDNKSLQLIFKENASYCIRGILSKHKCSMEDAEDIYIDAILNLREKIISGKIEFLTDPKNYLYATCQNMFLAKLTKQQRVYSAAVEMYESNYNDGPDFEADEPALEKEEMIRLTEDALSGIGDKCKDLLKSFYFYKLSMEEIAAKFNMASANVAKVSKSRCFQRLVSNIKLIQEQKNSKSNAVK
jgi:RNA polymerase sigma factor (sigma-70 family)